MQPEMTVAARQKTLLVRLLFDIDILLARKFVVDDIKTALLQ
jgi:hypothetical protein